MKVTLKYDQGVRREDVVTLEIPEMELEKMVENDYQRRLIEADGNSPILRRTPQEIIEEWNRQEYNAWRRHHRYIELPTVACKADGSIDPLETIADHTQLEDYQKKVDYDEMCRKVHQVLRPEQATMIIAICIDGMSVKDYAMEIGDCLKNVSKRYSLQRP